MVRLRLISMGLAALICGTLVYLAVTQQFEAVTDLFNDQEAVKAEIEEEEKPPPPPLDATFAPMDQPLLSRATRPMRVNSASCRRFMTRTTLR